MKTFKNIRTTPFIAALFFISPFIFSQQVVIENETEYKVNAPKAQDDNSLSLDLIKSVKIEETTKNSKTNKKTKVITSQELDNLLTNGNGLHFRKKRNIGKCFEETKDDCNNTEE